MVNYLTKDISVNYTIELSGTITNFTLNFFNGYMTYSPYATLPYFGVMPAGGGKYCSFLRGNSSYPQEFFYHGPDLSGKVSTQLYQWSSDERPSCFDDNENLYYSATHQIMTPTGQQVASAYFTKWVYQYQNGKKQGLTPPLGFTQNLSVTIGKVAPDVFMPKQLFTDSAGNKTMGVKPTQDSNGKWQYVLLDPITRNTLIFYPETYAIPILINKYPWPGQLTPETFSITP